MIDLKEHDHFMFIKIGENTYLRTPVIAPHYYMNYMYNEFKLYQLPKNERYVVNNKKHITNIKRIRIYTYKEALRLAGSIESKNIIIETIKVLRNDD